MRVLKTEGFVLKKKRLLNKDLLITLFTKESGKINILAKGVKNITSRRSPHLQTGNLINIVLNKKNDWKYLRETSLISAFSKIKGDPVRMNYKYFVFFLLDRLLPEDQKETKTYENLKKFLVELARKEKFILSDLEDHINIILRGLGYLKEDKSFSQLLVVIEDLINEKPPLLF